MANVVAAAQVDIDAPAATVWRALTDPDQIKAYFFGTTVTTDWQPDHPITWSGEYNGQPYEDKGTVLEFEPERRFVVTHFSPMTGQPDVSENYHTLTYELTESDGVTSVSLSQDNNADQAEADRATETWQGLLAGLKEFVESK